MPTDNTLYDLVTVLHNKMKGVAAYDQYTADFAGNAAVTNVLEKIKEEDEQHIEQLQQALLQALQGEGELAASAEAQ